MKIRPRHVLAAGLAASLLIAASAAVVSASSEKAAMTPREKAIHALNRLAFGPRPGDVDRVLEMGVSAYIEQQLKPERIPDSAVAEKLKEWKTLDMSQRELFDNFERPLREARRRVRQDMASVDSGKEAGAEADLQQKVREQIPPEKRPRRVIEELSQARIVRAAASERQLNEVLVDFWMNHFNIFAGKGLDRVFVTSFERDVVRPRIWGRFEDLLLATAKSPAMLSYLDNAQSTADAEHRPPDLRRAFRGLFAMPRANAQAAQDRPSGLNENYARELMELHTLGVDGGYTQKDVTELARVLTGWSIGRPEQGGEFLFRANLHDIGSKTVLGQKLAAGGGIDEGEKMIRFLAHHPATAHHIAFQLVERLVADDPPAMLVDRVAKRFLATDGDLRETVRAIVTSPEFFDPQYYRAKVKPPFEYVVSAVRAVGATPAAALPIARRLAQMGEPLYLCQPPTGYSDTARAWVNTGGLVARLNFALDLAADKLPGTRTDLSALLSSEEAGDPGKSVDALARALVGGELSPETRETITKRIAGGAAPVDPSSVASAKEEDPGANTQLPMIAGLILGSPEFQRQ